MCRWSISSGTQRAELALFLFIAADVPLEHLQRHSKGRIGSLTCLLPLMCRWSISSGTQRAELALFLFIAADVASPAALKGQNWLFSCLLPLKCPWRHSRGTQMAELITRRVLQAAHCHRRQGRRCRSQAFQAVCHRRFRHYRHGRRKK